MHDHACFDLNYVCKVGVPHHALRIVGQRARLQADDALAWDRLCDVCGVGIDDDALEHAVGVPCAVRVGKDDLVAILKLVEIPEYEITLGAWEAQAVACDIHVGPRLPGETRAFQVQGSVVQSTLIISCARVYGHVVDAPHLGDGQGHRRVARALLLEDGRAGERVAYEKRIPNQNQPGQDGQGGYEVAKHPESASSRPVGPHVHLPPLRRFRSLCRVGYTAKVTFRLQKVTKWALPVSIQHKAMV